jgi:TP901-1 family phage major tail protein
MNMAAQKGSAMLMKVGNGASPEVFTTIGGLRSTSLTINNESVDVTNKDSSNNRTMLATAGVQSISVSGSGVFTDAASETTLKTNVLADTIDNYQFLVPDFGTFTGGFQVTSVEYAGEYNGEVTYSMSFESSGAITFATV